MMRDGRLGVSLVNFEKRDRGLGGLGGALNGEPSPWYGFFVLEWFFGVFLYSIFIQTIS